MIRSAIGFASGSEEPRGWGPAEELNLNA